MSSAVTYDFIDVNEKASFSISAKLFPKRCAFAIKTFFCLSPLTKPGKIALTLMLASPNSIESDFVKPITPHLAAA